MEKIQSKVHQSRASFISNALALQKPLIFVFPSSTNSATYVHNLRSRVQSLLQFTSNMKLHFVPSDMNPNGLPWSTTTKYL